MEETTVVEEIAQADVAPAQEVYATDLIKPEPPKAEVPKQEVEKPKPALKSQAEIDHALSVRLKDAERKAQEKYETSPEYLAGKFAIDTRAAKDGVSREEAAKRIQQEYEQAENQRLAENPAELIKTLKTMMTPKEKVEPKPQEQPDAKQPALEQFIEEAKQIVGEAYQNGLLPDGFAVTPDLVGALYENRSNPYKLAAYLAGLKNAAPVNKEADAESQSERTPAPIRTTGENARGQEKDWRDVPEDEFDKILDEVKRRTRDGEKVRF